MREKVAVLAGVFIVGLFAGVLSAPAFWGPHYEALIVERIQSKAEAEQKDNMLNAYREALEQTDGRLQDAARIIIDSGHAALVDSALARGVLVRQ